jgi:hypothetical protein
VRKWIAEERDVPFARSEGDKTAPPSRLRQVGVRPREIAAKNGPSRIP